MTTIKCQEVKSVPSCLPTGRTVSRERQTQNREREGTQGSYVAFRLQFEPMQLEKYLLGLGIRTQIPGAWETLCIAQNRPAFCPSFLSSMICGLGGQGKCDTFKLILIQKGYGEGTHT